jgi:hypothetical protein
MLTDKRPLTSARIFFWCGASAVLVAFWRTMLDATVPTSRLVPGVVFAVAALAIYVGATLRAVRRLPTVPPAVAQREVLTVAAVGLMLVFFFLTLR